METVSIDRSIDRSIDPSTNQSIKRNKLTWIKAKFCSKVVQNILKTGSIKDTSTQWSLNMCQTAECQLEIEIF